MEGVLMKILLIGSGGREAALAWKISQSGMVNELIVCPGNPGMKNFSDKINLKKVSEWDDYLNLNPDLVVIGPEAPLSEGLADFFEKHNVLVVAPSKAAARLEGSKDFSKEIFKEASIPTPYYEVANSFQEAEYVLKNWKKEGVVVKVDALAQGKGVIVCTTLEEAHLACKDFFNGTYLGYKVSKILLEEKISGPEVSAFALCDGESYLYLGSATDYKRLNDDDLGPNTGGMGTISPSPVLTNEDEVWINANIFAPTLKAMKKRGTPFKGFLFAGLMKTDKGFLALEFNTRMGDPETQSLLPRLKDDLVPFLMAAAKGELYASRLTPSTQHAIHVVLSAEGYPGTLGQKIRFGDEITVGQLQESSIFFPAGVEEENGKLFTAGGRICGLTVVGDSLKEIQHKIYQEIDQIKFAGAHYRKDIGKRFLCEK
jgi:phosphoribosylamine--glycine ligase